MLDTFPPCVALVCYLPEHRKIGKNKQVKIYYPAGCSRRTHDGPPVQIATFDELGFTTRRISTTQRMCVQNLISVMSSLAPKTWFEVSRRGIIVIRNQVSRFQLQLCSRNVLSAALKRIEEKSSAYLIFIGV